MAAVTQQPQAKPPNANAAAGVLPVSTSGLKPKVLSSHAQPSRHGAAGLKVVIRRLPPGLTEDEFYLSVGPEWKAGGSKVDWASYVPGKVSKECVAECPANVRPMLTNSQPGKALSTCTGVPPPVGGLPQGAPAC
jgi:hypothetical protein